MKKQRYIVEIKMPDGDRVSSEWLRELIQQDCDVEDDGRQKVFVKETSLPSNLDEAVTTQMEEDGDVDYFVRKGIDDIALKYAKLGAEWMAGQGVSMIINDDNEWADVDSFIHKNVGGGSIIQIRKK